MKKIVVTIFLLMSLTALGQTKIPRNFSNVEFDGICFVSKKTREIEKIYNR